MLVGGLLWVWMSKCGPVGTLAKGQSIILTPCLANCSKYLQTAATHLSASSLMTC